MEEERKKAIAKGKKVATAKPVEEQKKALTKEEKEKKKLQEMIV